jgi:type I restriction enzyme S subunit
MSGYERRSLTDICEVLSGGTPKTNQPEYWNGNVPWASVKDFNKEGRWFYSTEKTISVEGLQNCSSVLLEPGDLILSARGTVGVISQCVFETAFNQSNYGLRAINDLADSGYVYYAMVGSRGSLLADSHGGMFDTITRETLARLSIPLPSLEIQEQIEDVLGSLDRKIESNRLLSRTLEEIAQTIFKSWFIDFDPVKAKMAGEKTSMDDATMALFPGSMEDSELGPIPRTWSVAPLTDFFEVLSGGTPKTSENKFWGGSIPWYSVVDAPVDGGCFFTKTDKTITDLGLDKSAAKVVRPGVTVISARGTVGKLAIVASPSTFNQSCYGLIGKHGDFYTYLMVKNQIAQLKNISHGGMFDTITRDTFAALKSSKPAEKTIGAFESLVEPLFNQIRNFQFENEQLSKIRDALLPRLISGELQIPEKFLVAS